MIKSVNNNFFNLSSINKFNLWIWLFFFSFAYEKPLFIISSFDRINPRLFDLVLLLGLPFLLKNRKIYIIPVLKQWVIIIMWFTFVVLIGALYFPIAVDVKIFMFYFLFEYYKGLLAIYIFLNIPKKYYSVQTIMSALIAGGLFVALYCVYELRLGVTETFVTGDIFITKPAGTVWGPYIGSYFEIALFVPLAFSIAFIKALYSKGQVRILLFVLAFFISWPVFFTGSRTAIFLFLLTLLGIILLIFKKSLLTFFLLIFVSISTLFFMDQTSFFSNPTENYTLDRLISLEADSHEDSIFNRISLGMNFSLSNYDYGNAMPYIGGGFYVAPVDGMPRVGYGIHNIFLFPFEQSGLIGLILFMIFIYVTIRTFRAGLKRLDKNSLIYGFIVALYSYFIASFLMGISAHTFWGGFSTYNFNHLRIILLVVVSMIVYDHMKLRKSISKVSFNN